MLPVSQMAGWLLPPLYLKINEWINKPSSEAAQWVAKDMGPVSPALFKMPNQQTHHIAQGTLLNGTLTAWMGGEFGREWVCVCMTESFAVHLKLTTVLTDCIQYKTERRKNNHIKRKEGPVSAKSCCVTLNNLIKPSEIQVSLCTLVLLTIWFMLQGWCEVKHKKHLKTPHHFTLGMIWVSYYCYMFAAAKHTKCDLPKENLPPRTEFL